MTGLHGWMRRIAGFLRKRLPEVGLDKLDDPRRRRGKRHRVESLLGPVLVGMLSGCKGLGAIEALTADLSPSMRMLLRIPKRVADTTMRSLICRLHPSELRRRLHAVVKTALRRKALPCVGLPFHAVAMDGKATAVTHWDFHYAQRHTRDDGLGAYGLVRTVTSVLSSTPAKPILDAMPIPAETNEMGIFAHAFEALCRVYGDLFRVVTYDAGATSVENAQRVVDAGKAYCLRLKNENHLLFQKFNRILGNSRGVVAETEDLLSKRDNFRLIRRLYLATAPTGYRGWVHARTGVRVQSLQLKGETLISEENRYYVSNLEPTELSGPQWLTLIRGHWAVENAAHWTLDAVFHEDDHPGIRADPRGTLNLMLLRRLAQTLLGLFRNVTLRSEENRLIPWRRLLEIFRGTLLAASELHLKGLRERRLAAATL